MARTRKSISTKNLISYDVLIEDRGTRSDYFKLSQFDGYFYGGRNAFLVAGSKVLRPRSKVLVEILNKDGSTVFSAPVASFSEGNSRLIQVEVYEDTPIGPGKIVILGSTDRYIDGTPIPQDWVGKYNVRWITDVIISPRIENRTPIRFERNPALSVQEKFYFTPSSSRFEIEQSVPLDVNLSTKYYNVFPNGYLAKINGPTTSSRYFSKYLGGVLTGSVTFTGSNGAETASINLPIDKIFTDDLAESEATLIITDKNTTILSGFISSSGQYNTNINPLGDVGVTSSLNLVYNELITENTGSIISFADFRLVDLSTISGEINKVRFSYKATTEPGEFKTIGEVPTVVKELLAVDTGSKIAETGKFRSVIADDYWYTATMSIDKNEINPTVPGYYYSASLIPYDSSSVTQCCTDLLDSINATPEISGSDYIDGVSYFIGTKETNTIQLFPRSEYTLQLNALVSKDSSSFSLQQDDYSLEVYLTPTTSSRVLDTNPLGQLIGTITPKTGFKKQNFGTSELNFTPKIPSSGQYSLRFVFYGGFWNIADVSVKPATEPFFSPDEINALLPNLDFSEEILTFKAEYLDVNNNSIGINTLSLPTFFTGSETIIQVSYTGSFTGSFDGTASYAENSNLLDGLDSTVFATTGSNTFDGDQNILGSLTASGLNYPDVDGLEYQFLETDGAGNLFFGDVHTMYEQIYTGEALTKGDPLYISGSQGAMPIVYKADAADPDKMPVTLIAAETIGAGNGSRAIILGLIEGIDLTGLGVGTEVYVNSGGGWTDTRPTGSAIVQVLGYITKTGTGGKGLVVNPGPANLPNLTTGHVWVGNSDGVPTQFSTASFATTGSNQFNGDQSISGSVRIQDSGSTIIDVQGSVGQLFTVQDALSGSLLSVNDISGIPILNVSSDDTVKLGTYNAEGLIVTGSRADIKAYTLNHSALGSVTTTQTIDVASANYFSATSTGNTTWTFSNAPSSTKAVGFVLELTNGGSYTQTWPASVYWPQGTAPTLTATGVDVLTFITDDSGTIWRGVLSMVSSSAP